MFWNGSEVYYGRVSSLEDSSLGVTAHNFRTGTSGTTTMRIVNNKVGIGVDSPKSETLWLGKGDVNTNNYWGLSSYIQALMSLNAYYNLNIYDQMEEMLV